VTIREKKQMARCVELGLEELGLPGAPFELYVVTGLDTWARIRGNPNHLVENMTPSREMNRKMKEAR
jgi:3-hydroxyacyl-CoA dehydrogenase